MQYLNKPKKQQIIRDNIDLCKRRIRSKRHFYDYVRIQEKRKRISFESEEEQSQDIRKEWAKYTDTSSSSIDYDQLCIRSSGIIQRGSTCFGI